MRKRSGKTVAGVIGLMFLILSQGCTPAVAPGGLETMPLSATATLFARPSATPTGVPQPTQTETAVPTPTALPPGVIAINPQMERQTIREVGGGNFVHWPHLTSAFEPVSEMNLKMFAPRVVRARMSLDLWEPVNDDSDAMHIDRAGFIDEGPNHYTFQMLQRFEKEGKVIVVSAWDLPNWMVAMPELKDQRTYAPEMLPEVAETIAAWLVYARDEYAISVDYISFNEADGGYHVLLSTDQYRDLILAVAERLKPENLEVKWLLADTAGMTNAPSYARWIYAHKDLRSHLGPLAFHSWDANVQDAAMQKVGDFAQQEGLEVWCTEAGYAPFLWQRPEEFPTWENAVNLTSIYLRALKLTRATTFLYWEMMAQDYPLNNGTDAYPAMQAILLLQQAFPAGAVILETTADPPDIKWTAARLPDGRYSLVLLNRGTVSQTLQVSGLSPGGYLVQLLGKDGLERGPVLAANTGLVPITIPANSILHLSSVADQ